MPNKNFIGSDGIIHNVYDGDQSAETLNQLAEEMPKLTRQLRRQSKKVLILTDITKLGRISLPGRVLGVKIIKNTDFDKVAIFGPSFMEKTIFEVVANLVGRGLTIRYFNNEKDARAWLTSGA